MALAQVLEHVGDGVELVVGLVVRKLGAELVVKPRRRIDRRPFAHRSRRRQLDQALGHLAQAFLGFGFARLPRGRAQAIELGAIAIGAVAGQQVDVFDRQVELGVGSVVELKTVVRRIVDAQRLQAHVAADAMLDMHDQVALRQGRSFGQEVLRPPALARPGQAVAQDVGLGNNRQRVGFKTVVERQHGALDRLDLGAGDAERLRLGPGRRQAQLVHAVVGQHDAQTFGRAVGPRGEDHALAGLGQGLGVVGNGGEQVGRIQQAFLREVAPGPATEVDDVAAFALERLEAAQALPGQRPRPFAVLQIEAFRLQRADIAAVLLFGGIGAQLIGVAHDLLALGDRIVDQGVEHQKRIVRQVVEQGIEPLVE